MNIKSIAFLLVVLLSVSSCKSTKDDGAAQVENPAQRGPKGERGERPNPAQLISKLDLNGDGKLSIIEAEGELQSNFLEMDLNEDGFLTADELEVAPKGERRRQGRGQGRRQGRG